MHLQIDLHLAEILDDVVSERIVIIDDQQHAEKLGRNSKIYISFFQNIRACKKLTIELLIVDSKLEEKKIVTAIAEAEKKTSGEIRVYISSKKREDALAAAKNRFEKLGMTRTKLRNGVLIFIAPLTQKFAIVGDSGIHAKCGEEFWKEITMAMSGSFKEGRFTEAIAHAVSEVGVALAKNFPPGPDDINELPNILMRD